MAHRSGPTVTDRHEYLLTRFLQLALAGLAVFGVVRGNLGVAFNAGVSFAVSWLPAVVRREIGLRMDLHIVLLITAAATLHAIGTLGPYRNIWWWDYATHAFSSFTVTGVAYAVVVTANRHADGVSLPQPYLSVALVLFSLAAAVLWEVVEFAATKLGHAFGTQSVLVVFGVSDIVTDIVFTALGGVAVAIGGTRYFRTLARKLVARRPFS
ncbi:hypothetical protein [Halopelagius longus]|uniref:DUF2238 domain-containing protein n=1 Tax=Halopelagius longus TaxID=1236180 RepID=A0A1H1GLV7_9EURY|nr:hypothetical protein [Halopelagius longus]RDI69666.1 hypothetical protein DWB78_18010 [Halopelagius longus]SDR14117.1 hypothetical protein SAMN05216278_3755 [Halopelagius longus]